MNRIIELDRRWLGQLSFRVCCYFDALIFLHQDLFLFLFLFFLQGRCGKGNLSRRKMKWEKRAVQCALIAGNPELPLRIDHVTIFSELFLFKKNQIDLGTRRLTCISPLFNLVKVQFLVRSNFEASSRDRLCKALSNDFHGNLKLPSFDAF